MKKYSLGEICFFITGFTAPASLSGDFTIFKAISYIFIGFICGYGMLKLFKDLKFEEPKNKKGAKRK
jgi:uncharacterized membrane protein YuzA (DUF378 family)